MTSCSIYTSSPASHNVHGDLLAAASNSTAPSVDLLFAPFVVLLAIIVLFTLSVPGGGRTQDRRVGSQRRSQVRRTGVACEGGAV